MASLTSLEVVREHLQISDESDTSKDELIDSLILVADEVICSYAQREFVSDADESTARDFRYGDNGLLDLAPYDLQELESIELDVGGASPSPMTLTADEYQLLPVPSKHGVSHQIELYSRGCQFGPSRIVRVTGTWGFPTVPAAVERAATIVVVYWMRETSDFMSSSIAADGGFEAARALLPPVVKGMLDPFRKRGI